MDGVEDMDIGIGLRQVQEGLADLPEWGAKILAPMGGHQDQALGGLQGYPNFRPAIGHAEQGIDDGIAGDVNSRRINALSQQVVAGAFGRNEMPAG